MFGHYTFKSITTSPGTNDLNVMCCMQYSWNIGLCPCYIKVGPHHMILVSTYSKTPHQRPPRGRPPRLNGHFFWHRFIFFVNFMYPSPSWPVTPLTRPAAGGFGVLSPWWALCRPQKERPEIAIDTSTGLTSQLWLRVLKGWLARLAEVSNSRPLQSGVLMKMYRERQFLGLFTVHYHYRTENRDSSLQLGTKTNNQKSQHYCLICLMKKTWKQRMYNMHCHRYWSTLVQVMVWCFSSTSPLFEPILTNELHWAYNFQF